mmetsp:Transcript_7578/g.16203  ORF Transcript_7578/g.16203 Transcript_7578/m.16203 type:complete len:324 (+) Transcript_7578:364-1335(+)
MALHPHGLLRGRGPHQAGRHGAARPQALLRGPDPEMAHAGAAGAEVHSRQARPAPRPEAEQLLPVQGRHEDGRLRHREGPFLHHRLRQDADWDAVLPEPGGLPGEALRLALRHLGDGLHPLRDDRPQGPLRRPEHLRPRAEDHPGPGASGPEHLLRLCEAALLRDAEQEPEPAADRGRHPEAPEDAGHRAADARRGPHRRGLPRSGEGEACRQRGLPGDQGAGRSQRGSRRGRGRCCHGRQQGQGRRPVPTGRPGGVPLQHPPGLAARRGPSGRRRRKGHHRPEAQHLDEHAGAVQQAAAKEGPRPGARPPAGQGRRGADEPP